MLSSQQELPGFHASELAGSTGLAWSLESVSPSGSRLYVSEADADGVRWFAYAGRLDQETRAAMLQLARGGPVKHFSEIGA